MVGASPVEFTPTGQLIPNQVELQRTLLRDLFSGIALFSFETLSQSYTLFRYVVALFFIR